MHDVLDDILQGKAAIPGKGDTNIRLLPGEGPGQGARLPALQKQGLAGTSSIRVWMGQGNGWSHPISLLDKKIGLASILLLIRLNILSKYSVKEMTCSFNATRERADKARVGLVFDIDKGFLVLRGFPLSCRQQLFFNCNTPTQFESEEDTSVDAEGANCWL